MDIEATSNEITEIVQDDPHKTKKAASKKKNHAMEEKNAAENIALAVDTALAEKPALAIDTTLAEKLALAVVTALAEKTALAVDTALVDNKALVEEKPKKTANKRKKPAGNSKKKKSKTEVKSNMPEDIKIEESGMDNQEVNSDDTPASVQKDNIIYSDDPMPLGQAKVSEVDVQRVGATEENSSTVTSIKSQSDEPVVVKFNDENLQSSVLSASTQIKTSQSTVLPFAAIKIRNIVGKIVNIVAEIIPNKVIIQGTIHEQVFFVGTDGIVHHLADDVPFSTFVDLPGAQPGMNAQVSVVIEDIIAELAANGLSILKKIILEVFVKVTETVQSSLLPGSGPVLFLQEVVGENTVQTLVETDVTLFTSAIKIDEIVGSITNLTTEVIRDKVIIQGVLHKQIFFVDTNNLGRHQAEDIPFSTFVDIPGALPGMDVQVTPVIEALFFNLVTPRIVRQKAVLEFFVKVTENIQQAVSVGNGPLFKVEELIGVNTVQQLSETLVTLSMPAIKVREIIVKIVDITTHVIENKIIAQGTIHKQIFFIGTDNIEHHQAEDIPFSLFLDIPGATPGDTVHISTLIEAVFFELVSDDELRQKVIFAVTATVTREIQLNLVLGTGPLLKLEQVVGENTKQILVLRREQITIPVVVPTVTTVTIVSPGGAVIGTQQIILSNVVELPVKAVKVKEIKAIVKNITTKIVTDGVLVEGTVEKTVFFVDTDNIVRSVTEELPFTILVKIPGISPAQVISVNVDIEEIIFSLNASGTAVNQTIVLKATVESETTPEPPFTVVTDVSGPGITQTKVLVQGLVLTPGGAVFEQFEVVTDVSGPGIISVTKQTVLLQVVGEPAPRPITVVTAVEVG